MAHFDNDDGLANAAHNHLTQAARVKCRNCGDEIALDGATEDPQWWHSYGMSAGLYSCQTDRNNGSWFAEPEVKS